MLITNAQKQILRLIVCLLVCFHSSFAKAQLKECASPLMLSASMDWFPYLYVNAEGNSTGTDIELLRTILSKLGCELQISHFPERRSIYELKKANFDVWLGASLNKERLADYHYSKKYRDEVNKFAYRSSDTALSNVEKYQDIIDLKKIVAINLAGWYGEEIEKSKTVDNNYIYSDTVTRRLKMLSFNRVDVVIDDYSVLCSELTRQADANITIHPLIIFETPIYFIFNKKTISLQFVEQFNNVLTAMKKSGQLANHFIEYLPSGCN